MPNALDGRTVNPATTLEACPSHPEVRILRSFQPLRLLVYRGGHVVRELVLDKDSIRIGRLESCDVPLVGEGVARFHAVIEESEGAYSVVDMGSPGGTFVDGVRVCRTTLAVGQLIKVGPYRLAVHDDQIIDLEEEVLEEALVDEQPEMVLVPVEDALVAAPAAKIIWSATPEEMAAEPPTGEVNVREALMSEAGLEALLDRELATVTPLPTRLQETAPVTGEVPIPLTVRRGR